MRDDLQQAKAAALEVLHRNLRGPCGALPRTAGWGYPQPYTRDLMISALGYCISGSDELIDGLKRVLEALACNQTARGHIPSLAHDPNDLGASDTTPLFLFGLSLYRRTTGHADFLGESARRALRWMEYQSPDDTTMVAQQPTSDWRDEHWVLGYGLYLNTLVYCYLRLFQLDRQADTLRSLMNRLDVRRAKYQRHVHEGLVVRHKPYYALWSYKIHNNERFDLLGNSLAVLAGIASPSRSKDLVSWIEQESDALRQGGALALDLPPCLFPYIQPTDPDWRRRYAEFNQPGEYHNGGVWPFICGFYVAALVAAGRPLLAERRLNALTRLVRPARKAAVEYGFNEWFKAQDGTPRGQDWQTWSAAMYLYAATSVEQGRTPFFDDIRSRSWNTAAAAKDMTPPHRLGPRP